MTTNNSDHSLPAALERAHCHSFRVSAIISIFRLSNAVTELDEGILASAMDVLADEANALTMMLDGLSTQAERIIKGDAS